jgi:hypothetical protein
MSRKPDAGEIVEKGPLVRIIEALEGKHSQLDINFQKTSVRIPGIQQSVELNGLLTVSIHMRDLTEEEKRASAQRNVTLMKSS